MSPSSSDAIPNSNAAPSQIPPPGTVGTDPGLAAPQPLQAQWNTILAPPHLPDEIGRLGGYRVLRLLGEGITSFVFEAEELVDKRRVAVKVLRPKEADKPEAIRRFLSEAWAAAALIDDHVMPILRVDVDPVCGLPFLVMPLLRGETLRDRLELEQNLPSAEVVRIGRETALGLQAAHAKNLIHRDLRPANLWMEEGSARIKVLDFGLARPGQGGDQNSPTGQTTGTSAYMAPEQARGRKLDSRCDLFSLGVVLYETATGRRPFQGDTMVAVLTSLVQDNPTPPHELDPNVPVALSALVMRLLAKEPDGRPQSAAEVVAALAEISKPSVASPKAPARRRPTLVLNLGDGVTLECVSIPAGTFTMGSIDGGEDEQPLHRVIITKPFHLGQFAVTIGQFRRFMAANPKFRTEAEIDRNGGWGLATERNAWEQRPAFNWKNPGWEQTDDHPVVNVSWKDAVAFCMWLSKTTGERVVLPTEAEWEYSCRAGSTTTFHFGNDPEELAKYANVADAAAKAKFSSWSESISSDDGYVFTAPVGMFRPNDFGLYDMHGNVCEWCRDGRRQYDYRDATDPYGPLAGNLRVVRGGSFSNVPRNCRSAFRLYVAPTSRNFYVGFRVAVMR